MNIEQLKQDLDHTINMCMDDLEGKHHWQVEQLLIKLSYQVEPKVYAAYVQYFEDAKIVAEQIALGGYR